MLQLIETKEDEIKAKHGYTVEITRKHHQPSYKHK